MGRRGRLDVDCTHACVMLACLSSASVLQSRFASIAFATAIIALILIQSIRFDSCWSYLDSILGIAPVQMSMCLLVAVSALTLMPKNIDSHGMLVVSYIAAASHTRPGSSSYGCPVTQQPASRSHPFHLSRTYPSFPLPTCRR